LSRPIKNKKSIDKKIRIQKYIASSGIMSRRHAEEAVTEGRVKLNGRVVEEMGVRVLPGFDRVEVDGQIIKPRDEKIVVIFNKPKNVITSKKDPEGRPTVMEYFPEDLQHLNPVGRLDFETEGLIVFTNNGELANRLMHPSFGVKKTYKVELEESLSVADKDKLLAGIVLEDGEGRFESINNVAGGAPEYVVIVGEGRNRFVRRMFDEVGASVKRLVRLEEGPLRLGNLKPGQFRELAANEVMNLLKFLSFK